jgi:hypothetical protein
LNPGIGSACRIRRFGAEHTKGVSFRPSRAVA